jgi:CBS domain containing-hemolysin-like protein
LITAAIAVLIGLAALSAAAEHALAEASRAKIDDRLAGDERDRIDRLLKRDDELALAAAVYRTALETTAIVLLARWSLLLDLPAPAMIGWSVLIVLAGAELLPRLAVARAPESALLVLLPAYYALAWPILPLTGGLLHLSRLVRRTHPTADPDENEAAEDILAAVAEGEKDGSIAGEEADMIENIVELRQVDVAEIMTPRPDTVSIDIEADLTEIVREALESGRSRLPVFRGTRDNIVGVLYVRDLVAVLAGSGADGPGIDDLMRPAYFVPETLPLSTLLRRFQEQRVTFAIVVDEYGGTAGVVTITDIVDAIVGEVREPDEPQSEADVRVIDEHVLEADGRAAVRKLNEDYGTTIAENDEYDTVAGFLCYALGRVPQAGDKTESEGTAITVLDADERRVQSVRITVADGLRVDD